MALSRVASTGTAPRSLGEQLRRRKPIVFAQQHHPGEELARNLSTFQLTMFGVGATVGTGIFFVLGEAVPKAGPAVLISFLVAGFAAGLSALAYAEMASAIPVSGSTYSYAYHALGEGVAVVIAGCVLLEYGVATGAVAVGWSSYFNELLHSLFGVQLPNALSVSPIPGTDGLATGGIINLPAVILIGLCALLLVRGATESARINTIMVLIKLGVLTLFSVIAFTAFKADHFDNFWSLRFRRDQRCRRHDLLLLHRSGRRRHGRRGGQGPAARTAARHHRRAVHRVGYLCPGRDGRPRGQAGRLLLLPGGRGRRAVAQILKDITGNELWSTILAAGR